MRVLLGLVLVGILGCGPTAAERYTQLKVEAEAEVEKGYHANNELKDHDTAILHFTEAIKIAQQLESDALGGHRQILGRSYNGLGLCYLGKGDDDKALAEFDEAIRIYDATKRFASSGVVNRFRQGIYRRKAEKASTAEERAKFEALADQEDLEAQVNRKLDQERTRRRQSQ